MNKRLHEDSHIFIEATQFLEATNANRDRDSTNEHRFQQVLVRGYCPNYWKVLS